MYRHMYKRYMYACALTHPYKITDLCGIMMCSCMLYHKSAVTLLLGGVVLGMKPRASGTPSTLHTELLPQPIYTQIST